MPYKGSQQACLHRGASNPPCDLIGEFIESRPIGRDDKLLLRSSQFSQNLYCCVVKASFALSATKAAAKLRLSQVITRTLPTMRSRTEAAHRP